MDEYKNHHATIFVPAGVAGPLEAYRRAWDPVMAQQIAAHLTLIYPQEVPGAEHLIEELRRACPETAPFRLRLSRLAYYRRPEDLVYVGVTDTAGACRRLRERVLRAPSSSPVEFPLHVTLIHPRTSSRGREFLGRAKFELPGSEFLVTEVAITAFDGARWATLHRFALGAR